MGTPWIAGAARNLSCYGIETNYQVLIQIYSITISSKRHGLLQNIGYITYGIASFVEAYYNTTGCSFPLFGLVCFVY
jgi:hypothetical protein